MRFIPLEEAETAQSELRFVPLGEEQPLTFTPEEPGLVERTKKAVTDFFAPTAPAPAAPIVGQAEDYVAPKKAAPPPLSTQARDALDRKYDSLSPEERNRIITGRTKDGRQTLEGMYFSYRDQQFKEQDAANEALTQQIGPSAKRIADLADTRKEARARVARREGAEPKTAENIAAQGAIAGLPTEEVIPQAKESPFDFDLAARYKNLNPVVRGAVKGYYGYKQSVLGLNQALGDLVGAEDFADTQRAGAELAGGRVEAIGEKPDYLTRNFEGAVNSVVQNIPGILGGIVTGGALIPLSVLGVQSFGQNYTEGVTRGLDRSAAAQRAGVFAAAEILGERFGLPGLTTGLKKAFGTKSFDAAADAISRYIVSQIPGEQLTTATQFLADKYPSFALNPQAGIKEYLQQAGDTLTQTIMQGGLMLGGVKGAEMLAAGRMGEPVPAAPVEPTVAPGVPTEETLVAPPVEVTAAPAEVQAAVGAAEPVPGIVTPEMTVEEGAVQPEGQVAPEEPPMPSPVRQPVTPQEPSSETAAAGMPITELPLKDLTLSKDVPQFKMGADEKGVVEPLGGKFERTGVAPIQVWRRLDGNLEVISGRHRLDLAKRSGEKTIPAQIHDEAQGFTPTMAAVLDAELNIRDGQGKVKDYVNYFKAAGITQEDAESRGLLARSTGKRAFTISTTGSDELVTAVRNDQVGDEAAYYIALNAPNDPRLQAVGIQSIMDGKSANMAVNTMAALKALGVENDSTTDMFGFDDSAMKEAAAMAQVANRKQREIQSRLSAITGAAKRPEVAKAEGIDIRDEAALNQRIGELRRLKADWDNWATNPELIGEIRQERGVAAPALTLRGETEEEIRAREEAEAAEAQRQRAEAEATARSEQQALERQRADETSGLFELGQTAEQQLSGMGDLFAAPAETPAATPEAVDMEQLNRLMGELQKSRSEEEFVKAAVAVGEAVPKYPFLGAQVKEPYSGVRFNVARNHSGDLIVFDAGYTDPDGFTIVRPPNKNWQLTTKVPRFAKQAIERNQEAPKAEKPKAKEPLEVPPTPRADFDKRAGNAIDRFVNSMVEQFDMTPEAAMSAFNWLRSEKLVSVDAVTGQTNLKDGRFWDGDVLRRAALESEAKGRAPGATDAEVAKVGKEFAAAEAAQSEDEYKLTHVFDPPAKDEVVRLTQKGDFLTPKEARARINKWKANARAQAKTRANSDKVVLSLFDLTGEWSKPWLEAGYQVYRFDIQDQWTMTNEETGEVINLGDVNNFSVEFFMDNFSSFAEGDVHAILAACPCTDFASSGARHFKAKDASGKTMDSVQLVHQTLATIEYFRPPIWALENPVGRIEKLTGLPPWRLSFDPYMFGDPYTKKTLLWGRFNPDLPTAPVDPVEGSKMHRMYGGKSLATKNARSVTPEGFAYAFFQANNAIDHPAMALANQYDRLDPKLFQQALDAGRTEQEIRRAVDDGYYFNVDDQEAEQALRDLIANGPEPLNVDLAAERAKREAATWSPERIDALINEYQYLQGGRENDTKAYAAFINPAEFVRATSAPGEVRQELLKAEQGLDLQRLQEERQTPFLAVKYKPGEKVMWSIDGHEGRHRMAALAASGVERVPVLIRMRGEAKAWPAKESQWLSGQKFGTGLREKGDVVQITNLTPISFARRDELQQRFGGEWLMAFNVPAPKLTSEQVKAERERVKAWINKVNDALPALPADNTYRVLSTGPNEGVIIKFSTQRPLMAPPNTAEIEWFEAFPRRAGSGTKGMRELQRMAAEDNIALSVYPWTAGGDMSGLVKFYRSTGFRKPANSKIMVWEPKPQAARDVHTEAEKQLLQDGVMVGPPVIREAQIREYAALRQRLAAISRRYFKGKEKRSDQFMGGLLQKEADMLKQEIIASRQRRDSAEAFLARALQEYEAGNMDKDVLDVVVAAYNQNPMLLEGVMLRVTKPNESAGVGTFNTLARIVRLYKYTSGVTDPKTIRHELTHSMEQMMTGEQRAVVVDAWRKGLARAMDEHKDEVHQKYFNAVLRFLANPTRETQYQAIAALPNYDMYQFLNPSEYWAVNAEKLMASQLGGKWQQFKTAMKRLWEGLKKVLGFDNRSAVHSVFKDIMNGTMERRDYKMLTDYAGVRVGETLQDHQNIEDDDALLEQYKRPKTPQTDEDKTLSNFLLNQYKNGKGLFKDFIESPVEAAADAGDALLDGALQARMTTAWYGAGLESRDFSKYGGQLRTSNGLAVASVALDNAIHGSNIGIEVLFRGGLTFNPRTGRFEAANRERGMRGVYEAERRLKSRIGKQRGQDIIQSYLEAKRSISIMNEFYERQAAYEGAKEDLDNAVAEGAEEDTIKDLTLLVEDAKKGLDAVKKAVSSVTMSEQEMDAFAALDQRHPELRDIMDNWTAINQNMLRAWRSVGLLSEARYNTLAGIKDYVPWQRIMEDGEDPHTPLDSTTRTLTNIGKEKLFRKGPPTNLVDFKAKEGQNTFKIPPSTVLRVEVDGQKVPADRLSVTPDGEVRIDQPIEAGSLVVFKVTRPIQNIIENMTQNVMRMTMNTIRHYAAQRIVSDYATRAPDGRIMTFPTVDLKKGRFRFIMDGKPVVVEISDPLVVAAIYGMDKIQLDMIKPLAAITNFVRRSITLSGVFQLKQVIKDSPTAAIVTGVKHPELLIGGVLKGFVTALMQPAFKKLGVDIEPTVNILKAAGIGGFHSPSRSAEAEIKRRMGIMNRNVYDAVIKLLDHIGDSSDMAQRIAVYKRVLAETGDQSQAVYQAANVINFLHRGSSGAAQAMVKLVPFMGAYANSIDVLANAAIGGGLKGMSRKKAMLRLSTTVAGLAGMTILYCMLVGDSEDYEELDDQTKLRNLIVPGTKIAIPMNTSAAFIWKALPEMLYNKIIKEGTKNEVDRTRLKRALSQAARDMLLGPEPVPAGARPVLEVVLDHNFFTGRSVIPRNLQNVESFAQYDANTSELAKMISAATEFNDDGKRVLSPIEADHLIRGLFGSIGFTAQWISNSVAEQAGARPAVTQKETPVAGAFLRPEVARGNEDLFYDLKQRVDEKYATWKTLMDRGQDKEADVYETKNEDLLDMYNSLNKLSDALSQINSEIRELGTAVDLKMTPDERRKEIEDLQREKMELLDDVKEMRKEAGL